MRRLVARTGLRPPTIAAVAIVLVGLTSVVVVDTVLRSIDRNKEAIEVGCLLVVQVVRDSGANSGQPRQSPEGRAQARITAAFTRTLMEIMPPARRAAVTRDRAIVRRAGGSIPEPNCRGVADDPAKVRRETLQPRRP